MRGFSAALAFGLLATALASGPSHSAPSDFDIRGVWAAGKSCQDADLFVEFDGREVMGGSKGEKARIASYSAATAAAGRVTVSLSGSGVQGDEQVSFLVEDSNEMRLDSAFLSVRRDGSAAELMKLTRCTATI
ncbi:MAG: hypothetical protein JWR08_1195 [Enterovirga sp.]|nr:hypothetical protein [Enterovirga sp.]